MKNKQLEKKLHNYFKNYKDLSNKFSISSNKNEYGIIFNENELEEKNKNINLILDEDDNYYFCPLEKEIKIDIYSLNSILLNKEMKEYNEIYKDYYNRLLKYNKINENEEKTDKRNSDLKTNKHEENKNRNINKDKANK